MIMLVWIIDAGMLCGGKSKFRNGIRQESSMSSGLGHSVMQDKMILSDRNECE